MMRIVHSRLPLISLVGALLTSSVSAQTPLSVRETIRDFHNPDLGKRMAAVEVAVEEVRAGRVGPFLDEPDFANALFAALHEANDSIRQHARKPDPAESLEAGEGRGDDLNLLAELFMATVPSMGAEQQRAWVPELIRTLYSPDSLVAIWMAEFGDLAVDDLVTAVNHPDLAGDSDNARAVLAHMVALTAPGPNSRQTRHPLSVTGRQKALQAVRSGLDPGNFHSREIVRIFRELPSIEGLALLQDFARRSRGKPEYSRRVRALNSLQDEVDDAIRIIQLKVR